MIKEKKYSLLSAREKAKDLNTWLREHKAQDINGLDLMGSSPLTDVVVICTANSLRHGRSLADGLMEHCTKENYEFLHMEGYQTGQWILVDLNDVIIHIFLQEVRELYHLESLWRDATPLTEN